MFLGDLFGLVLAEVSFETDEELDNFPRPPFAIADVTNSELFTGGKLCELAFADIREEIMQADWRTRADKSSERSRTKGPSKTRSSEVIQAMFMNLTKQH